MKKQLFLFLCTLLSMLAGVQKVQAYTVENLVEDGWTLVNSESVTGVADNFYVLVDAYSSAYVMSAQADHFRPCYKTINSPLENPSFVWSLEGSDNSFKLKSAATGAYIKQASGWDTSVGYPRDGRGVATCTFTLNGGKYDLKCIESNAMVGHWNDGTSGVAQDGEDIAANKSTTAADGFFLYAKPKADYIAALAAARQTAVAEASQTNPVEVTSWIQNADFSNDWGGWECTLSSSGNMQWGQKTLESWNASNVVVKQTLSGVPDGLYRLSADLISGNNDNKTAYVFAIGASEVKSDPVSAVASAGNYGTMSAEVAGNTLTAENIVVTNGVLTVGFNQPSGWIVADNFKLYYMGEDMSIYVEAYHDARTAAAAVDQEAPMKADVLAALQLAITDYSTGVDETSKDALLAATSALGNAASDATNSIAAYAKAASAIATAEAMQVNNNFVTPAAATTFADAIAAIKTPYTSRTLANEEAENAGTSLGVVAVGWHAAATNTPASNYMISTWPANITVNDWSVEGAGDGSNYLVPFFQDWIGDGESLAAKTWTATLTGLESGIYTVSAWVRVRAKDGATAADATGITMDVNGGGEGEFAPVDVTEGIQVGESQFQLATYEAVGKVIDGTLTLNFNVLDGNNISWLSFKDVKYVRTGDIDPTDSREAVAVKLTAAEGLLNEVMNVNVAQALSDAIAATAGYEESTDIDALEHMANDLDAALTAAQTSVGKYQEAADIINAAVTLDAAGQAVYAANETVLQIKAGYDARTLEAATVEQKELCQAALKTAVKAQTTDGADWTLLIDNADLEGTFTSVANPQANRDIYQPESWTAVWENGNENDLTSLNSSCTQWDDNFKNMPQPADGGNNVYWARYRWGKVSTSLTLKQTVNLPAGLYEVGAEGYLSNAVDGKATLSVKFGDKVALTDFTVDAWTKKAVVFSISETQDVEFIYNFAKESKEVEIKAGVDNFTLTSRAAADADDYAALNAAIKNAESMKIGFKAGEYAPYTNVAVLAPLAAAKAIDQTAVNAKSAVVIATSLLNDAQSSWVENTENMPIVYNGTFVASENDGAPAGWETDNAAGLGGQYHARAFVLNPEDGNYDNLATFKQEGDVRSCFYVRFDGTNSTRTTDYTYGETVGYTMPLEAGVYRVKLMAGGWGQTQPLNVKFEDAESTIKGEQTLEMARIDQGDDAAKTFDFLSEIEAGNYKLVISNGNTEANNAAAFSNVAITLEMTATELAALREEIILLRTKVEGYTELPEPLATEATDAVAEAYGYINEHECDPAKLNACKDRLQAVVDAVEAAAWQAQIADAQTLAADDDAVAVGKLRDAIEDAIIIIVPTDEEKAALQAAVDQFNLDNADQESDQTAKVATSPDKWTGASGYCATQFAPAITTYDGRNSQLVENFNGATGAQTGKILYQTISGLTNGTYKVGFYANAFSTADRDPAVETGMVDGAEDVAYVYANEEQKFIVAHRATSTTENGFYTFDVQVTDGAIELGLAKDKAGTNWHTLQIYQLTWFTTAKALYALDKADMEAAILLAGTLYEDPYKTNGKEELQQAIAEANAARISNHLNITEFEDEIAKLNAAIEAFKVANYVAFNGTFYVKNAAGKYMAAGHNWGTRGIVNEKGLDLTLTPNNENKVKIDSRVSNGGDNHFLSEGLYMDGAAFAWAIEQVGAEEYSIGNGAQYIGVDAEDNLALVNEPFAWQFLDAATVDAGRLADGLAAMTAATADNGVDATFLLKDADFNRNDLRQEAWTKVQGQTGGGHSMNLGGGGANGYGCAEAYHTDFTVSQVVANAPAGVYKLNAQGFYRQDEAAEEAIPVFYIGDATAEVPVKTGTENDMNAAGASFAAGNYEIEPVEFVFDGEGDLEVGIRGTAVNQWVIWDNFRLTYYGPAPVTKYAITVAPSENGNVVADKATAAAGETVKVTATPDEGYMVDYGYYVYNETQYDFESIDMEHNIATFTMPAGPVSVVLAFKQAKVAYQFVPSEWGAGDPGRISPENVVANDVAGTITVDKTGANNVNLNFHTTKRYVLSASQRYFVIKATGLATGDTDSYLWWLNHNNNGSQIVPTAIFVENGETVFAWDAITSGIGGTIGLEDTELNGTAQYTTTFGMTLADAEVPAVISYIGFQETIPEPVEEYAYEFVPSEWGAGDAGRISPENVVADDEMGTITVDQTGDNNVCLLFKTNKLYYVENVDYFVIKAKGVSTEAGASKLWWLNGKNDGGLSFEPTSTATEDDDTIILEWKISECGNIGENINPVGKSYLLGGEGWTTTFGLTQADALTPVVISYIGYGTKSATAISAAKSHNGEGALKDGKYLIKGEIIVVKNGKLYKANGQLK